MLGYRQYPNAVFLPDRVVEGSADAKRYQSTVHCFINFAWGRRTLPCHWETLRYVSSVGY
jgi:hypothetical protein